MIMDNPEIHNEMSNDVSIYNLSDRHVQFDPILLPSLVVRIKAFFVDIMILLIVFISVTMSIDAIGDVPTFIKGFLPCS